MLFVGRFDSAALRSPSFASLSAKNGPNAERKQGVRTMSEREHSERESNGATGQD